MHYYKRNIGDYAKKAGKLTMLQHGAYTLLLDACYDRERFPTLEDAIEWAWADTPDEIAAVEFVLRKFFKLKDGVYVQERILEDMDAYRALSEANSRIAKHREAQKKARKSTERAPVVHEAAPNHKPLTKNQEPLTTNHKLVTSSSVAKATGAKATLSPAIQKPDDVEQQTWDDWCQLRKAKKATVTHTVVNGARKEAGIAGMSLEEFFQVWCRRGSQGLEAAWLRPDERNTAKPRPKSFAQQEREAGWARWEEQTNRIHPDRIKAEQQRGQVIDITKPLEIAQ